MKHQTEKHIFSFYAQNLNLSGLRNNQIVITDPVLCNRISSIVRLQPDDECFLFDHQEHAHIKISSITKKQIVAHCLEHNQNRILSPSIIYALPLIKKEALETALDALTQLGATQIQLLMTHKVQRSNPKELDRLERIIHAAAEQSKNFSFPLLKPPCTMQELFTAHPQTQTIVFHPNGQSVDSTLENLRLKKPTSILLMSGPEGDFTHEEMALIKDHKGIFTKLTPTILRAELAAALGLGIIRSFL